MEHAPGATRPHPFKAPIVRRAIILAAGSGQRLRPLTDNVPKCLVEVAGEPILLRTLSTLAQYGVREVVIVVGHLGEKVVEAVGSRFHGLEVTYVWARQYATTNNICSLWEARGHCDEDLFLIEGDVVFEGEVIRRLMTEPGNAMAAAPYCSWHSGTVVRKSRFGQVASMVLGADQHPGFSYADALKTVNIYRLGADFLKDVYLPAVSSEVARGNVGVYYESVLRDLIAEGKAEIKAVDVGDRLWYEIDDHSDLEAAEYLFAPPAERLARVSKLHGGYWRYGFTDHSYLYNLYYPPEGMLAQFQQDMRSIITNYPVGQNELARLVSNWTGMPPEQTVVANGASELIKILGRELAGPVTIPVPSFNEYENVVGRHQLHRFFLDQSTFELDVEAFADRAVRSRSKAAIVVTPSNPTSLSLSREEVLYLAERLRRHDCFLVVDESFIEFAEAGPRESVQPDLDDNPNILLLKSMSKVFGIAGLRLGYLLSSDTRVTDAVRRQLPIWNVNGLGEAFLRSVTAFGGSSLLAASASRRTATNSTRCSFPFRVSTSGSRTQTSCSAG